MPLPNRVVKAVCSSPELEQFQPLDKLPSHIVTLVSSDRISEMKNGSFPGLDPLKNPRSICTPTEAASAVYRCPRL